MSGRVAIISTGLATCAGCGTSAAWKVLRDGGTRIKEIGLFASPRNFDKLSAQFPRDAAKKYKRLPDCAKLLFCAIDEAVKKFDFKKIDLSRIGVFFGTSVGGIFEAENMLLVNRQNSRTDLGALAFYECSTLAELAAKKIGARGECATYSTACSSSGLAMQAARNVIVAGELDAALVCGADSLSRMTVNGFASLMLLSKKPARPFDKLRDGINLGEAAGALFLADEDTVKKIGAVPVAFVAGCGCTTDAYHPTAPQPQGEGAARAIRTALAQAKLSPEEIDFVYAHGTATKGNDSAEAKALVSVFGNALPPFASVKGSFGHTLGAAGILNAVLCTESVRRGEIPPNVGFENFDEEIRLAPNRKMRRAKTRNILSLSLGFGGNNAAAVVSDGAAQPDPYVNAELFVYGAQIVSPACNGISGAQKNFGDESPAQKFVCEESELLRDVPPLKKRKWAKLQLMFAEAASDAALQADAQANPDRVCICAGTSCAMAEQTERFVKNVVEKAEAEPMPTVFTNSVHNAITSAAAQKTGFKGLNSAVTAKEISFECALKQASREILCGVADAAIVGSADEKNKMAEDFLAYFAKSAKPTVPLADAACAYFMGRANASPKAPIAKILECDIKRREFLAEMESEKISAILSRCGVKKDGIVKFCVPSAINPFLKKYLEKLEKSLSVKFFYTDVIFGTSGALSGFAIGATLGMRGVCAQYSPASTGMRAFTVWEVL